MLKNSEMVYHNKKLPLKNTLPQSCLLSQVHPFITDELLDPLIQFWAFPSSSSSPADFFFFLDFVKLDKEGTGSIPSMLEDILKVSDQ